MFRGWNDDDQDYALAWCRLDRERCSGCGTRLADWERDRGFLVGEPYQCPGCEQVEIAQEAAPKTSKGVYIRLRKPEDVYSTENDDDE